MLKSWAIILKNVFEEKQEKGKGEDFSHLRLYDKKRRFVCL